jgi:hypothetical protein
MYQLCMGCRLRLLQIKSVNGFDTSLLMSRDRTTIAVIVNNTRTAWNKILQFSLYLRRLSKSLECSRGMYPGRQRLNKPRIRCPNARLKPNEFGHYTLVVSNELCNHDMLHCSLNFWMTFYWSDSFTFYTRFTQDFDFWIWWIGND